VRKDILNEWKGMQRLKKENQRKRGGKPVSALQQEYNKYIIVVTSVEKDVTAEQVLEFYRARWQIEIAFKQLKSIFEYNEMPARKTENIKTWFYGKLLLAALCETLVNTGRFPPQKQTNNKDASLCPDQMSLWRELRVILSIVTLMLFESLNSTDLLNLLSRLSWVCADSKRKRRPQLCSFDTS